MLARPPERPERRLVAAAGALDLRLDAELGFVLPERALARARIRRERVAHHTLGVCEAALAVRAQIAHAAAWQIAPGQAADGPRRRVAVPRRAQTAGERVASRDAPLRARAQLAVRLDVDVAAARRAGRAVERALAADGNGGGAARGYGGGAARWHGSGRSGEARVAPQREVARLVEREGRRPHVAVLARIELRIERVVAAE